MPDEPSLHDVLRGSLAHHAEHLGEPSADIATVWFRVDRRRARRRGIAVVGSVAAVAAGAAGIMLVANPSGSTVPLDGSDGSAALAWACTGPLGSDGTYDYFEACDQRPRLVAASTTPVSIVGSTIAGSVIVSTTVPSAPPIGTAPPTTAFSPFVGQQHVVAEGDSVYGISEQFGVEPEILANFNGWTEGINRPLVIGEQVLIPPTDIATVSTLVYAEQQHVVVGGDSLTAIAERYGVRVTDVTNYNGWPEGLDHVIRPGDVVRIPPYSTGALPPVTTAIISVPVWSGPACAPSAPMLPPTTTSPPDVVDVSVPCGSVPATFPSGAYGCTGLLGLDELYRYYSSCEVLAPSQPGVPVSTIAFPGGDVTTTTTTFPPPLAASTVPGEVQYTIGLGDNPGTVADMFGITVEELVELNPEVSQTFNVGQVLRLPPGSTVVDPQEQQYVAVDGDSLTSIAERYGIDIETLVAYNGWADGIAHPLVVDETVKIPPGAIVLGLGVG